MNKPIFSNDFVDYQNNIRQPTTDEKRANLDKLYNDLKAISINTSVKIMSNDEITRTAILVDDYSACILKPTMILRMLKKRVVNPWADIGAMPIYDYKLQQFWKDDHSPRNEWRDVEIIEEK